MIEHKNIISLFFILFFWISNVQTWNSNFFWYILYFHYELEHMLTLSSLYLFRIQERKFASSEKKKIPLTTCYASYASLYFSSLMECAQWKVVVVWVVDCVYWVIYMTWIFKVRQIPYDIKLSFVVLYINLVQCKSKLFFAKNNKDQTWIKIEQQNIYTIY